MHKYRFFLLDWHLKFWCCRHGDIDNTDQSETKWFLLLDWIKLPCVLGNSYYLCIIFVLSSNYLFLFSRLGQVALYVGAPWQQQWTSSPSWESSKGKGVLSCLGCFGQYLYTVSLLFSCLWNIVFTQVFAWGCHLRGCDRGLHGMLVLSKNVHKWWWFISDEACDIDVMLTQYDNGQVYTETYYLLPLLGKTFFTAFAW